MLFAAETSESAGTHTTFIMLKVDATEPLEVKTAFRNRPPVIVIQFPPRQVIASIPERTTITKGIIQDISATYSRASAGEAGRYLESIRIAVSAPYPFRVRSELGRVIVEIDHPVSVKTASLEVGLRGGTIIGAAPRAVTERFLAMQDAMTRANPALRTIQQQDYIVAPIITTRGTIITGPSAPLPSAEAPDIAGSASSPSPVAPASGRQTPATLVWVVAALMVLAAMGAGAWGVAQAGGWSAWRAQHASSRAPMRMPSGVILIDQLVWRAFERQGHQLVAETELTHPPFGTLRVITKDGAKRALLFVGHGPFFEKQTVERFVRAMKDVGVEEGLLVAAGSFTVPAQRIAKEHQVTLIGREQLTELLSAGAGSEYFAKQLEQQHERLEEAKATLQQFAGELDTLRRQRNEASWYLGEERARSAKMETQLEDFHQQLRRYETDLQRWQQEAATLRKQWEENEWYLGESRERAKHLESQLAAVQPIVQRVEAAETHQQGLEQRLTAERAERAELESRFAQVQQQLQEVQVRERSLHQTIAELEQSLAISRMHGERRRQARIAVQETLVELHNGKSGVSWLGTLRDLSRTGFGIECAEELPALPWFLVTIQLPGREPIESKTQVRWQQPAGDPIRYRSGCKFVSLPRATRALIDELVETSPNQSV